MAEQKVIANLNGIDEKIRQLNKSAKEAAASVKDVSAKLQFDPNNVKLVTERFTELREELKKNQSVVKAYEDGIKELEEENRKLESLGDLTADQRKQYDANVRAINKYSSALENARRRVEYLKAASDAKVEADKKQQIELEKLRKKQEQTNKAFEAAERATKRIAVAVTAFIGAITKAVKSSVELGTELYNLSVRYNTNVEQIQIWNRALQLATGQTDLFTTAVNTMIKGLSQISAGRGVAYRKSLQNIGLAYRDLEGLTTAERFRAIVEALGATADANVRLEAAQQLLGESGQSIAQMFEDEKFNLDAYLKSASEYGTLTQQNATELAQMGFQMEYVKSEMQLAAAQMTEALTPAILVLLSSVKNITKAFTSFTSAIGGGNEAGAKFLIFLTSSLIVLPVIIKLIKGMAKSFAEAAVAASAFQKALGWISIALEAIALLASVAVPWIVSLSGSVDDLGNSMNGLYNAANSLSAAGEDFGANVESVSSTSNYREIQVGVEMHASGDTPISDEAAVRVGQITVDEIQKALGDLVK